MSGIKNFITGFTLSLFSVALIGQLSSSATKKVKELPQQNIKIDLFKTASASVISQSSPNLFAEIKKESFIHNASSKPTDSFSAEGTEDDEILSVNIDGIIPIEYASADFSSAEVLYQSEDDESAMLPADELMTEDSFTADSPWVIAKGSKHIKNKKLLEQFENEAKPSALTDSFQQAENEAASYKVAEKIKQSIIFPIPDEILNDENLTPTFIKPAAKQKPSTPKAAKKNSPKTADELKIIPKETPKSEPQAKDTGIFNSISSWFSDKPDESGSQAPIQKKRAAPTYGRANNTPPSPEQFSSHSANEDLADFYETLQETKEQYTKKIVPSELKMSFRPERAEISGSTLQWLKMFSEATEDPDTYLEVRLDASASTELQKKRLSLLYSIFANNGVDFTKVNTIFSSTEPNAFIIKVIRLK